ncbi:hypothetical protein O0I10_011497 [Lichtheimia ornata]|uniref:Uncharacterized protein n=1 Tax=Lichtheimia ornata TaxID=688661 RepID=A0AAD7XU01_9FUNG|nr:uncharacterized protein O0I10_011497 [Lichtheimia ornata]KAJ8652823.1 hypothetical protein O0I10_011497 [Lichtheimia ornata]
MDALKEYFVFATTFAQTGDSSMLAGYRMQQERQRKNKHLVEVGVFGFIDAILRNVSHHDTYLSRNCVGADKATIQFVKIVKHVLTGFHLLSHSTGHPIADHERTL